MLSAYFANTMEVKSSRLANAKHWIFGERNDLRNHKLSTQILKKISPYNYLLVERYKTSACTLEH